MKKRGQTSRNDVWVCFMQNFEPEQTATVLELELGYVEKIYAEFKTTRREVRSRGVKLMNIKPSEPDFIVVSNDYKVFYALRKLSIEREPIKL